MRGPIACLGLGLLGSAAAERLRAAGREVRGYDLDPTRTGGATRFPTAAAAAAQAALTVICLPDGPAVGRLLFVEGVAAALPAGSAVIDLTTCSPAESRAHAGRLDELGIEMLDAPVSGSSAVVRAGEGVLLVGGPVATVARCRPVLEDVAPRVLHCGDSGAGSAAKLVTNLVLGLNRLALAEGLFLAERLGLPPAPTLAALREGAAYSRALDAKGERMVERRYDPDARLLQHLKDVELILALGQETGAPLPVSRLHRDLLRAAAELGFGESDNAAIIEALRALAPPPE